jgi:hypothetical protein
MILGMPRFAYISYFPQSTSRAKSRKHFLLGHPHASPIAGESTYGFYVAGLGPTGRADLAADLAPRREVRVDVCISVAGANRGDDFGELLCTDLLTGVVTGNSDYACGRNRPGERTRSIGAVRRPGWTLVVVRLAEPEDDAAVHTRLSDMDMRLCCNWAL